LELFFTLIDFYRFCCWLSKLQDKKKLKFRFIQTKYAFSFVRRAIKQDRYSPGTARLSSLGPVTNTFGVLASENSLAVSELSFVNIIKQ
jgi:predicted sugar kinase